MKKLFLSFSALLAHIVDGTVTQSDLDQGFFMFGCTRTHAFEPGAGGETDERKWNKGKNEAAYEPLIKALVAAEAEGRAGWVRLDMETRRIPVQVLNEMLERNGMQTLNELESDGYHVSHPDLRDRILQSGIPLETVF